jgi:AraC-like DNA-binding protein
MCDYRELAPPRWLARYLTCGWTISTLSRAAALPQRVLPDGCIDIIWLGEAEPVVVGPATRPVLAALPPQSTIFGLRFQPGLAPSLLGPSADQLRDCEVPLRDLWGAVARSPAAAAVRVGTAESRLAAASALLADRLAVARPVDEPIAAAVQLLSHCPTARVTELSRQVGLSERQLQRRFDTAVGLGPKTFQRVVRFHRWLGLAQAGQANLADLAAAAGYADQAHLTREATRLAGLPPARLLADGPPALSAPGRPPARTG